MLAFSVVVLTKNEEGNIFRCISPWLLVAEVVVLDNGSTDKTMTIAREAGAKVYSTEWRGYGQTKNIGNELAAHDWILSLDADEVANEKLVADVCNKMSTNPPVNTVFSIQRSLIYLGKKLKYGSCRNEYRLRLFHRGVVRWNDRAVHEELILPEDKQTVRLKGYALHYSYVDAQEHWLRLQRYAALNVEEMKSKGRRSNWVKRYISAPFGFVKNYILRLGFLDGKAGWSHALNEYRYRFLKYKLLHESISNKKD